MRRSKHRQLSQAEHQLWSSVAQTVTPLDHAQQPLIVPDPAVPAPIPKPRDCAPAHTRQSPVQTPPVPRFGTGDPQRARRVGRRAAQIAATLDLHGMRQIEAEMHLRRFVLDHHQRGAKLVLIVTGKGSPSHEVVPFGEAPRGVLRRRFLEWIEAPPLSGIVAQVQQAHQRHGGGGAFYVFLKQARAVRTR